MSDYLIIQKTRQKINIVSATREYKLPIGASHIYFDVFYESFLIYMIYVEKDDKATTREIRGSFPNSRPEEIEAFVTKFKEDHVLEDMESGYEQVPCIASEDKSLEMRSESFKYPIYMTLKQEKLYISYMKQSRKDKVENLIRLFTEFCDDNGIHARTKSLRETEGEELANLFCQIHGVDMYNMIDYDHSYDHSYEKKEDNSKSLKFVQTLIAWGIIAIYIIIAVGFLKLGSDSESFWISFIWYAIGSGMIYVGYSKFMGK